MFDRPPRSRSGSNSPRQESANQSSYAPNTFSVPQRTRPNNGSGQPERKRPRYDPTLLDDSASEAERLSPTRISREEPTSNVEMFSDEPLADYSLFGLEMQDLAALGQENLQGIPAQQVLKIAREKVRQKILAYLQQSGEPKDRINIVAGAELTNANPKLIIDAINDLVKTKQIERLGKHPNFTYKFLSETPQTEKILPEVARQKILAYLQQSGEPKDRINIIAGAELINVNPTLITNAINDLVKTKQIERLGKPPKYTYKFLSETPQTEKILPEVARQKILAYLQQSGEPKDRINIVAGAELTNVNPKLINRAINDLVRTKQIERLGKPPKYTYKFLSETPQTEKILPEVARQKILAYLQQSGEPKDRINIVAGAELTNVNPKLINRAINDLVRTKQIERLGKPPKYTYKFLSETPQTEKILPEVARQKILAYLQQSGEPKDRINIVAGAELTNVNPRLIDNAINDLVKTKQIERLGKHPNFTYRLSATSHKEPEGSEYVVSEAAQATLDNFGLESVHVHPDGDCLYNALIQAGAPYSDAGEFREAVAGYVRDRFYNDPRSMLDYNLTEQVLGFMDLTNLGQESFINFIRTQGSFDHLVGDLTPLLISMMLDRSINIIHPNGTNDIVYPNGTAVQNADANQSHGAYTLLRFTEPNDHYYATKERQ
ncbi:MAG: hypothetical protein CLLPBCKN_006875 [Chroococcidiopsis cubana SAG 39.79]|nr:hypothetical protein [Chroococcidiopsis cubana SAG 39.79]